MNGEPGAVEARVHPSAVVHPDAELHDTVQVGPGCLIGPGVEIGAGVRLGAHVVIEKDTSIGEDCRIFHGAALGSDPQDLKYAGEATRLEIGSRTTIREYCTMNRGTAETGITRVGSDCLFMAGTHVAHDCDVGNHVILANVAMAGGHVSIGDWAILGALVGVHQFARIGEHAFIGGASKIAQDIPPYTLADGNPCSVRGINSVGLRRRGFSKSSIEALRRAFRTLFRNRELNLGQAIAALEAQGEVVPEVQALIEFIRSSKRGVVS